MAAEYAKVSVTLPGDPDDLRAFCLGAAGDPLYLARSSRRRLTSAAGDFAGVGAGASGWTGPSLVRGRRGRCGIRLQIVQVAASVLVSDPRDRERISGELHELFSGQPRGI